MLSKSLRWSLSEFMQTLIINFLNDIWKVQKDYNGKFANIIGQWWWKTETNRSNIVLS